MRLGFGLRSTAGRGRSTLALLLAGTINALLADVAGLKAGGGTVTPTPTINNTPGTSTLLGSQVSGFTAYANALDTRLTALGA